MEVSFNVCKSILTCMLEQPAVDIDFSTMSSSLGAVTAVTWEDMLKWYFGKYSNATQTIINKVISEEFE